MAEEITVEQRKLAEEVKKLMAGEWGPAVELRDQLKTHGESIAALEEKLDRVAKDMMPILSSINKPQVASDEPVDKKEQARLAVRALVKGAFRRFDAITPEEKQAYEFTTRALSVTGDSTGGLIVPAPLVDEIVSNVTEIDPIRQVADVGPTTNGGNERLILRVTTKPTTAWTAENGTRSVGTDIAFGTLHIPVFEEYAYLPVSYQMLEDTNIDLQGLIAGFVAEDFAEEEGKHFVNGTGAGEAEGFMMNGDVSYTAAGEASTLTNGDCLISLSLAIKEPYRRNAVWIMNDSTWAAILKTKGGDGQYLYRIALSDALPNTLLGKRVLSSVTMPSIGANTYPVIFGDFKKGYAIADHLSWQFMVDEQTGFTSGVTYFKARRRVGGAVKVAEAIRKLKIATS